MSAHDVTDRYFDAWNRHDTDAIAGVFTEDGTYSDPVVQGLGPVATADYAASLFAGFSDLAFEIQEMAQYGEGLVVARWLMTGTNDGPFQGLPPSGRTVRVPGSDFLRVDADHIREVDGYFDTAALPRQLGLQVVVQPSVIGPFTFGVCTYVSRSGAEPGAVSLTVLEARSEDEKKEVRERSRAVLLEMLDMPGFISSVSAVAGNRMFTVTAWEGADDSAALRTSPAHAEAMGRFFGTELARSGQTSVWAPHRLNGLWVRCEACHEMAQAASGVCQCGADLPAAAYW